MAGSAEKVEEALGERATIVDIGHLRAAISRGDQLLPGLRPYSLWWSDGTADWSIIGAVDDPRDIIDLGRSMVCG